MGTWLEKSKECLCKEFNPGGLFSPNKFAERCKENFNTAKKHLPELVNTNACGKKLVRISSNRYTLIVPDDPFELDEDPGLVAGPLTSIDGWILLLGGVACFLTYIVPRLTKPRGGSEISYRKNCVEVPEHIPMWEVIGSGGEKITVSHEHQINVYGYCPTCRRYIA